ncbi:Ribosomal protein L32p [Macleaya cordata]|uniref:Large ribosomal subunit protein bL32m n=1 Tax=Macleaya cordata TaxID=56857 RepID=A0A200QEV2_MACCD|nr:Ribosomal protein L32p [Macleaya cordata]
MAFRMTTSLKRAMGGLGCRISCPLERAIERTTENAFALPELDRETEKNTRIEIPTFSFGGSMDLMAVPKKKVSKHKRGIRNGPKALKPIPVIIRCNNLSVRMLKYHHLKVLTVGSFFEELLFEMGKNILEEKGYAKELSRPQTLRIIEPA